MIRFAKRVSKESLLRQVTKLQLPIRNPHKLTVIQLSKEIKVQLKTYLENWFLRRIKVDIIPFLTVPSLPGRNCRHLPESRLEFDFSWKSLKIAIEIQGGLDQPRTGHRTAKGVRSDMRKVCLASLNGWILLQLAPEHITDDVSWRNYTLPMLTKAFHLRQGT